MKICNRPSRLSSFGFILLLAALLASSAVQATIRKVYFIGNSYTYSNNMPDMLRDFTTAQGDTIIYSMSAPGGYTFQQHTTNAATLAGIAAQPWDIIVLQEQSQLPSFPPSQVVDEVYPFATRLDSVINETDSCIETMFMMTWGRKTGDASNCPSYPIVCTYEGMQIRLRESYMQMAMDNRASVAPMGAAWKVIIDSFPAIELYQTDESHPSIAGSYLQACVFYTSIFHRSAQGCTYLGGVPAATAQILQRIADKVVLDSMAQWQQYGHVPHAGYTHSSTTVGTVSFSNASERATSYNWDFGDGSSDVATNPTHSYSAAGIYTVTLSATNECITSSATDTVQVGGTMGSSLFAANKKHVTIAQSATVTTFMFPATAKNSLMEVYDMSGSRIKKYLITGTSVSDNFAAGLYVYRIYTATGDVYTGKFSTY